MDRPKLSGDDRGKVNVSRPEPAVVRVLDHDRDLAESVGVEDLADVRSRLVARSVVLEAGEWEPSSGTGAAEACPGLLVLDGMVCREVLLGDSVCAELIGPGDLVRPWRRPHADGLVPHTVRWHVLTESRLAILGPRFMSEAARWPALATALVERGLDRCQKLALSAAISCGTGLRQRLLMLFWHLADRWGRVRPDGVVVPVPLTHELISRLVGARRPSVSTALKQLERDGALARLHRGGWLLAGDAPSIDRPYADGSDDLALTSTG